MTSKGSTEPLFATKVGGSQDEVLRRGAVRHGASAAGPSVWERVRAAWWLPLVPAAILMLWSFVRLQQSAGYASEQLYPNAASSRLAWSDIIAIYGRASLAGHPFPYITGHSFEYPVLTGVVFYLAGYAGYAGDATPAFFVNWLLLAAAGLYLVALIAREPGSNPWLLALSPALVLYCGANWDLLAVAPGIAALLLYRRGHDMQATVLLAVSVWLKFFAILWLPLVLVERVRRRDWAACIRISALFTVLSVAVNLPFALRDRYEWGLFFSFNRVRAIEVNFWTLFRDYNLSVDTVNYLSLAAIVLAIAGIALVQLRRHEDITVPAAAALIVWFFFINKVYSPQYFIWLVPFLALLAAPIALAVGLAFVDVIYYVASFQIVHMGTTNTPQAFSSWDFDHVLEPAMELRELAFLFLLAWIVLWRLRAPEADMGRRTE